MNRASEHRIHFIAPSENPVIRGFTSEKCAPLATEEDSEIDEARENRPASPADAWEPGLLLPPLPEQGPTPVPGETVRIPWHELVYKERVVDVEAGYEFTQKDFFLCLLFIPLFLWDVVSDIRMAALYFGRQDWLYGIMTVVPVVLAYIVVFWFALLNYQFINVKLSNFGYRSRYDERVAKSIWVARIVCLVLGATPVIRTIEFLMCGYKSWTPTEEEERKKYQKDKGLAADSCSYESWKLERAALRQPYKRHTLDLGLANSTIRIFESYVESAPQLCLQLYILFKTFFQRSAEDATVYASTILSSWFSLALSATTLYKFQRLYRSSGKMSARAQLIQFLWRASETGGRVLCMTLFASTLEYRLLTVLVPHVLLVAFWYVKRKAKELHMEIMRKDCGVRRLVNDPIDWKKVVAGVFLGYVSLFYFPLSLGRPTVRSELLIPSRYVYVGYYIVFHLENIFMLISWAWLTPGLDFGLMILSIGVFSVFLMFHIVAQVAYYKFFHPNCDRIN